LNEAFRIRVRIEEDVAMVEGRHQLQGAGQEHAVAEHVAGHVAHPRHRDRRGLDVDVDFAEMALDRLPRAAGGDAHLLVVVALAAAGREGVAEPMALLDGQGIGRVREGGRALVGGHHQIGIVPIVAQGVRRGRYGVADDVVGELQERAHEDAVAVRPLGEPGLAIGGRRQLLRHEAALRAHRHDDGILDLLRLHEAENFGTEVLRTVGPAQSAARHLAEAQMHALDPGRIHEDLVERTRRGKPSPARIRTCTRWSGAANRWRRSGRSWCAGPPR
jgi:hypothetical protein